MSVVRYDQANMQINTTMIPRRGGISAIQRSSAPIAQSARGSGYAGEGRNSVQAYPRMEPATNAGAARRSPWKSGFFELSVRPGDQYPVMPHSRVLQNMIIFSLGATYAVRRVGHGPISSD